MKSSSLFVVCLVVCLLLQGAEPRKSRGSSSRGGSKGSRGSSRRQPQPQQPASSGQGLSHSGLSSLSYSGYNSQPAKKPAPSAPQPAKKPDTPVGWNVNKDTNVKKEVGQSQSNPGSNQPAYPAGSGLSGSSGAQGGAAHAYPASNGLSGTGAAGQHSYPSNNAAQQHTYPVNNAAPGAAGQQHTYPAASGAGQHAYPASNGLSGSGPSQVHPQGHPPQYSPNVPAGHNAYPANSHPGYNNNPYGGQPGGYNQGHPPPYSPQGYGGMPGYGGAPPGYGGAGYGGMSHGGFGGGMGGFGGGMGGFGGNSFGGYYGKPKSSFLSGNKFGLILAGLAVWNLARSGQRTTHNHYYNTDPNAKVDPAHPNSEPDPILKDLVNCTLTMTSANDTDVVLIPCVIATSFSPEAKLDRGSSVPVFTPDSSSPLNCTINVLTTNGTKFSTNIPCESLSSLAPKEMIDQANEPEPPLEVIPLSTPSTTTVIIPVDLASLNSTSSTTVNSLDQTSTTTIETPLSTPGTSDGATSPKPE